MATKSQIKSSVWSYSISGGGAIAEGLAAIRQCLHLIIVTTKGTDPLRPEFGSNVYKYVDSPITFIPQIKKAVLDAVRMWEKRVTITQIDHRVITDAPSMGSALELEIGYKLNNDDLTDSLQLTVGGGNIVTGQSKARLILQALFPPNPSSFQYQVACKLNGADLLPAPSPNGFADPYELYLWVKESWLNYGRWYMNADSIVGYINPQYSAGSISISILTKSRFQGGIPRLQIGYKYSISITVDGVEYTNDTDVFTPEQVRQWAQENLGDLGFWQIVTNPGSFNDDFSEDFELFLQLLVVYTSQASSVIISITTIEQ